MTTVAGRERPAELLSGALCGAAGGLLAAGTMILFAHAWSLLADEEPTLLGTQEEAEAAGNVVEIVAGRVLHVRLEPAEGMWATAGFHFAFGTLVGASYGALAEVVPAVTVGAGAPFGGVEWLLGNKITAPRFGLLRSRESYSKQEREQTLASHVVFGIVTELTRRVLRKQRSR